MNRSYQAWLPSVLSVAKEAAVVIMDVYRRKTYQVQTKTDNSPVTEADLRAHQIIQQGLQAIDPSIPIISEEGEVTPYEMRSAWARCWLVDPLDGTQEFIRGSHEFTINIALIEANQPVLGVVVVPVPGDCYWAIVGEGAYMQKTDGITCPIRTKQRAHFPLKIVVSHRLTKSNPIWEQLVERVEKYEVNYCGSSLKMCLVAKGGFDLYPQPGLTSEWDTAAGHCIVEAAGGAVIDLSGHPLRYNQRRTLVNPRFYAISSRDLIQLCCG